MSIAPCCFQRDENGNLRAILILRYLRFKEMSPENINQQDNKDFASRRVRFKKKFLAQAEVSGNESTLQEFWN